MNSAKNNRSERQALVKGLTDKTILSNTFKVWLVGILFLLIFAHLYSITQYPNMSILPTEAILGVALFLTGYLWIQELRDRSRLEKLNKDLVDSEIKLELEEIETIAALVLTEEAKDPYVHSHSKLVALYSKAIAQALGLSEEQQETVERAGKLHDLGKLSITDAILKKPGKLTEDEWSIMRQHPRKALDILKPLDFLETEKDIILHHHERFDGRGYPDHLVGTEIPIEARIIAVADTFDAMNSKRPYRDPLPKEKILEELETAASKQLDSEVVHTFMGVLKSHPEYWRRN